MTRECNTDFDELIEYIKAYSIANNLEEDQFTASLKEIHKCYFSAISWSAELSYNRKDFLDKNKSCTETILDLLSESASDLGSSLFNWINGSYKTARIMLRVGLENFVRAIGSIEEKSLLTEKNTYKLFEKAKQLSIFKNDPTVKAFFQQLHTDYKTLCKDAHTESKANMEHLSSLAGIPIFKKTKARESKVIFTRVAKCMTGIFCITFNDFYHKMHHRNKENILNSLTRKTKSVISGADK